MAFKKVILAAVEKISPTAQLGGITGGSVFIKDLKTGESGKHYGFSVKGDFADGMVLAATKENSTEILDVTAERWLDFHKKADQMREQHKELLSLLP